MTETTNQTPAKRRSIATASRDALIERLCERMHRAYEDAAVVEGWATQEASRKPWADVPAANQRTMRASVEAALALLEAEGWGDIRSATEALDARCQQQADALRRLGHDPAGEIVSVARHRAVVTQLEATIASLRAGADHSRCRHHDGICSAIVDANEAMGEALIAERAEVERLRAELARFHGSYGEWHILTGYRADGSQGPTLTGASPLSEKLARLRECRAERPELVTWRMERIERWSRRVPEPDPAAVLPEWIEGVTVEDAQAICAELGITGPEDDRD
jgi:hypothetical protein